MSEARPAGGVPRYAKPRAAGLFSRGFRPFFLAAGVYAVALMLYWLAWIEGAAPAIAGPFDPVSWHAHEVLFGVTGAAIAGFLLTAIPNWTGRLPLQGAGLAGLCGLWLAGRLAVATGTPADPWGAAAIDLSFPVIFLSVVAREILAGRNTRNLPMVAALAVFALANAITHAEAAGWAPPDGVEPGIGLRLGLATPVMLIVLIGGRITPSFTRNWLVKRGATRLPAAAGPVDGIAMACALVALLHLGVRPYDPWLALTAGAAATALALRLARWRGTATAAEPLLLALHIGYAWLPVGFATTAAAAAFPAIPLSAAFHAFGVGAIGTMTLAVMTRATLGHSGAALTADRWTLAIFAAITLAAFARLAAAIRPQDGPLLLALGAGGWILAYGLFSLTYGPRLLGRRDPGA
ncbi:MAG: NnrS family protein [Marivibrio sp.]|uniref:NnrS family protein n=1 Tax=Marivibrio sp. TaxID=2039719 RepID=UPI0032EED9B6